MVLGTRALPSLQTPMEGESMAHTSGAPAVRPRVERPSIPPIATPYGGALFRSRLEARYAFLFDHLGIRWQYEAEAFVTSAGAYLADFYLPESDLWVEIKPAHPTAEEIEKCRALAEGVPGDVRLLYGPFGFWTMRMPEQRAGGIGFWREREGEVWHGQADGAHRYLPAVCADCGAFGVTFAGVERDVCRGVHRRDVDAPLSLPSLYHATRMAEAYRFDGGR
jgi:hypothetical protein